MKRSAVGPWATYRANSGFASAASAKASRPSRSSASANACTVAAQSAASSEPAPVSATTSAVTISGYASAKLSAMFPPIERPPTAARRIFRSLEQRPEVGDGGRLGVGARVAGGVGDPVTAYVVGHDAP